MRCDEIKEESIRKQVTLFWLDKIFVKISPNVVSARKVK